MKKYLLLLAVLLTGFYAQAQTKVGTIDAEYILGQLPEIATVEEGLKPIIQICRENYRVPSKSTKTWWPIIRLLQKL
jgi:Skp family chaperone for outer membrane proteins